ncbi:MAG: hypothetical protein WCI73_02550 [Phycisphaerae bacterium]
MVPQTVEVEHPALTVNGVKEISIPPLPAFFTVGRLANPSGLGYPHIGMEHIGGSFRQRQHRPAVLPALQPCRHRGRKGWVDRLLVPPPMFAVGGTYRHRGGVAGQGKGCFSQTRQLPTAETCTRRQHVGYRPIHTGHAERYRPAPCRRDNPGKLIVG